MIVIGRGIIVRMLVPFLLSIFKTFERCLSSVQTIFNEHHAFNSRYFIIFSSFFLAELKDFASDLVASVFSAISISVFRCAMA